MLFSSHFTSVVRGSNPIQTQAGLGFQSLPVNMKSSYNILSVVFLQHMKLNITSSSSLIVYRLMKFLCQVINNWFEFALIPTYVGIQTHDLPLTTADVLTSRPPSLPNDDWPARSLYSCGFHDIYRLMKFLHRVINNWYNFALSLSGFVRLMSYNDNSAFEESLILLLERIIIIIIIICLNPSVTARVKISENVDTLVKCT